MERKCKDKHVIRDNDFGITWCIRCGCHFKNASNKPITEKDREVFKIVGK